MRPRIPPALAERIERVVETNGYASTTEFVREAIRRRLEEVEDDD